MTGSERPSPEPFLKKRRPQPYWVGENSGNALDASNALNDRAWGIPVVLSMGNSRKSSQSFSGVFHTLLPSGAFKIPFVENDYQPT